MKKTAFKKIAFKKTAFKKTAFKKTAIISLLFAAVSYPAAAAHHHHFHSRHAGRTRHRHHYAYRHHGSDGHAGHDRAHRNITPEMRSRITCDMVRAYVAQVGVEQARAMAQAAGMTASEARRARRCLESKV